MTKHVEFFFDVGSPAAYLAWTQMPALCKQAKAELIYRPFLLGGVFKATGNSAPATVPAKGQWLFKDLNRFAKRYGVPLNFNPFFPINTLHLMRAATAIQQTRPADFVTYVDAAFRAIWVDERNMNDANEVAAVWQEAGFDAEQLLAQTQEQAVKDKLKADTQEAVTRGAFGAPTFFVEDAMFFGQDRMDFVREALG